MPDFRNFTQEYLSAWAADMLTEYFVIPEIGEVKRLQAALVEKPSLKLLRLLVEPHLDGEQMERVRVFWNGEYVDMFVGERSAINGRAIRNIRATEIYHTNIRVHDPDSYDPATARPICGPAVLFSRRVWF